MTVSHRHHQYPKSTLTTSLIELPMTAAGGDVPQGWKRQQRVLGESTDSDLDSLARYATYPAERVYAFYSLAEKKSERKISPAGAKIL
ncbi:MAG: hypothetical protein IJK29_03020 [Bacteroidales bacterium]|nr:hypothetical protein [Bacteroidales bacterium]